MDGFEHSFPLPETEAHKLDEVKEVLNHSRGQGRAGLPAFVQSKPWLAVALASVGGLFVGLWWSSRSHSHPGLGL
jgi:ElaB/YqjD/DUF883 family membrane-anchored ribosome-binding protein